MLAKIKHHRAIADHIGSGYVGIDIYLVPYAPDDTTLLSYINAWSGNSQLGAYAELMRTEQCYRIVYPAKRSQRANMSIDSVPVLHSLLEDIRDSKGEHMMLVKPANNIAGLNGFDTLGTELFVTQTHPHYEGDGYMITDGPYAHSFIRTADVQPYTDKLQNPYEKQVLKIAASGSDIPSHAVGYHVPIYKHKVAGTLLLGVGKAIGSVVRAGILTVPATEKEEEIFKRKEFTPFQLQLHDSARSVVEGAQQTTVGAHMINMSGPSWIHIDCFYQVENAANYLMVDKADHTRVSYLPQNKVAGVLEKGQDVWDCPARQTTTWAKVSILFLNSKIFNASQFEQFGTQCVSVATELYGPEEDKPELVVVRGKDVAKYYNSNMYEQIQGTLGGSCMRKSPANWFDVYSLNPNQVGLLICRDRKTGKIYGRALLWTNAEGRNFIDRRYGTTHVVEARMLNHATKNLSATNIWGGSQNVKGEGNCTVVLDHAYHTHYPYIDSMAYLNPKTRELSNLKSRETVTVKSTGGGRDVASYEARCAQSAIIAPKEEMEQTASGDWAFAKYVKTLRSGKKELEKRCLTDELEGGLISKAEAVAVQSLTGKKTVSTTKGSPLVAELVNLPGHIYRKDELVFSKVDGGFIPLGGAVQMPDGAYCLPASQARYLAILAKKKVNKVKLAVQPCERQLIAA